MADDATKLIIKHKMDSLNIKTNGFHFCFVKKITGKTRLKKWF